ncbi:nuclear transport factor 2 family protein [Advenella kashmirensis]|nr:nuclear transport factor 2 family protein [Advenella kashmirensis]
MNVWRRAAGRSSMQALSDYLFQDGDMMRQTLSIRQEFEALAIDYWHEVDSNWGENAHEFYTEDATFTTSMKTRRGQMQIQEFYRSRRQRGARVSLHIVQNFRAEAISDNRARCNYIMSLYAADGEPVLPSRPPIMIAAVTEILVRQPDQSWRYSERTLTALFRDETPTTG